MNLSVLKGRWIPPSLQDGLQLDDKPDTSCLANFRLSLRDEAGATAETATGTGALPGNVPAGRPMAVWGGRTGQMTFEFETMSQSPRYVVCRCQYCDGGIEFDASDFELSETRNVECPHCRLETRIFVPATAPKPDLSNPIQPSTAACSPPAQTFLLTIGRIGITSDRVVTPSGTVELAGSQWCFLNMSKVEYSSSAFSDAKPSHLRGIPLPILLLMCFFSALSRKATISGYAEVSVQNGIFHYKTQIPINSHADLNRIRELVNKAQSLAT